MGLNDGLMLLFLTTNSLLNFPNFLLWKKKEWKLEAITLKFCIAVRCLADIQKNFTHM